ncbi:ATP-dependent Zn protease [Candidatus Phytoplasma luffae]|uniref:ATP-dependent Zn protease n=2 Tax=Loofah witches'-broom phytoplasma TaxID=35773 RepID=A0A975ILS0_LOWBP|nr:ATP-dependent Zn protease [Candidatus Phytoplasma luffae]QTX02906.1 ATP-dependent Zn protease [Candidatus Phytoplasma luffae]QTX02928.1 ATP-dependent Zn protease [Candidatus Phytoplasma luffae]QTX02973.1 ATP-dependent Zn protease [Candidatus Phytoplasma luffae]QTX02995.1 ATP-dependent Zn protease [Candidatus Phytoplasma luffae]
MKMNIKKNQNKNLNPTNLIIIIITSIILFLGIQVWIHHQALIENQTQILNHHKRLETQNKTNQETKKYLEDQITKNNSSPEKIQTFSSSELQEKTIIPNDNQEELLFKPSNNNKFPGFNQLIGFKEEKQALDGFIDYLNNKENYQNIGEIESPLGILMYGAPGTGKTTLARSLAKETNLPFFEVSSSLFSQKYKGIAPQLVKDLFMTAREEAAQNNGAIIFLDECETIFTDLSTLETDSEIANVVNQFKTELTSFKNNPEKPIFIIGATNHINQIDDAIKSRFTYNIEVKPGNKEERKQFLEFLINKRKNPYSEEAKQYLYEVINEALEILPPNHQFKQANRTLENLLKTTVTIFAKNRGQGETRRNEINKEDLKQAYKMIISPNINILDQIEKNQKGDE